MIYMIRHDLISKDDYEPLYEVIKSVGPAIYDEELGLWFVKSGFSADQIYEKMQPFFDEDDRIFIAEAAANRTGWISDETRSFLIDGR